jgi:hypothetical protein
MSFPTCFCLAAGEEAGRAAQVKHPDEVCKAGADLKIGMNQTVLFAQSGVEQVAAESLLERQRWVNYLW